MTELRKRLLKNVKRVVIKVGASVLTTDSGVLDIKKVSDIASQARCLKDKGVEVIVVSSGAIAAGMSAMGLKMRPTEMYKKQAIAAIGQIQLMKLYDECFRARSVKIAQVLLTQDDFSDRKRYLNAKHTLFTILSYHTIPIINENDTVATDEIKFGDNDKLSGLVANLAEAQLLIMLSDVDGLWDMNKEILNIVQKINADIERLAKGTTKETSTGGMVTKLEAAKAVTANNIACVIANGHMGNILVRVLDGENVGTLFLPAGK